MIKLGKTLPAIMLCGALAAAAGTSQAATVIQEGFNETATPDFLTWGLNEVGWYWTPESDFSLTGIQTRFRSGTGVAGDIDRTVTIVLMDDRGGSVLASGTFDSATARGGLGGVTFGTAFDVDDAVTYFVGFQNVLSIGINIVGNTPQDESFENSSGPAGFGDSDGTAGNFAFAFSGGNPANENLCLALDCPVIAFLTETVDDPGSDVPEPATMLLLAAGAIGLGAGRRFRARR